MPVLNMEQIIKNTFKIRMMTTMMEWKQKQNKKEYTPTAKGMRSVSMDQGIFVAM